MVRFVLLSQPRCGSTLVRMSLADHALVEMFGEVFNVFNIANLSGFSGNLAEPSTFGQPTNRATQVFGSGGPRAFQVGARLTF